MCAWRQDQILFLLRLGRHMLHDMLHPQRKPCMLEIKPGTPDKPCPWGLGFALTGPPLLINESITRWQLHNQHGCEV